MKLRFTLLALLTAILLSAQQEKRLTVYSPQTSYAIAILDREGREYIGLVDLLEPLGKTSGRLDGDTFKLHFNSAYAEFKPGKSKAKIRGKAVDLGAPFLQEKDRGLIPIASLALVLARVTAIQVSFHESARRVFLGGVTTQFTAELLKTAPSRLVLHFSAPVNPSIATEPGRLRMIFSREPLLAAASTQSFDDKLITTATFAERNGAAELTITGGGPLLASFSDEGRTITISAAPQPRVQAAPPPAAVAPPAVVAPTAPVAAPPPPRPRFLVVIDPGHGGDDRGAILAENMAEKDVTLAWARRLRAALERDGIAVTLLRESDAALTAEQRAAAANAAHPAAFIAVHAGTGVRGVRVYTAHMPDTTQKPGSFLRWETAQAAFLDPSRSLAGSIAAELGKHEVQVSTAPVLMRPLTSVAAAAVALEVTAPSREVLALLAPEYQQSICAAIADGIAAIANGRAASPHPGPIHPLEAAP